VTPFAELEALRPLGTMVAAAAVLVLLTRPLRLPSVVAFIVAGLLLGAGAEWEEASGVVRLIGESGVALLLFVVGLEMSLAKVRGMGTSALLAGVVQVALTAAAAFLLLTLLGWQAGEAVLVGGALAFSSTAVAVKLLDERRELDTLHGRLSLGVLLVQDVMVIAMLTVVAGMGGGRGGGADLVSGLAQAVAGALVLMAGAALAARLLLPPAFRWIAGQGEATFVWSLAWCFLLILAAERLHLTAEIGAFLAGVTLAQLPHASEIRRRAHPLMVFFLAIFFVTLGVETDLGAARGLLPTVLPLGLLVIVAKLLLIHALLVRAGHGGETAFRTALTLSQVSEFGFVVAALAHQRGLMADEAVALVGAMGLLSIGVTSPLILASDGILARLRATRLRTFLEHRPGEARAGGGTRPEGHVLVVGMNSLGRALVRELCSRGESVLAVDTDPVKLRGLPCRALVGSAEYPSVLEDANLAGAKLLVSALNIEDANILLLERARRAGVPASIHAFHTGIVEELETLGADHLIVGKDESVRRIADELRRVGVLA